jgi:hypothetical protein
VLGFASIGEVAICELPATAAPPAPQKGVTFQEPSMQGAVFFNPQMK